LSTSATVVETACDYSHGASESHCGPTFTEGIDVKIRNIGLILIAVLAVGCSPAGPVIDSPTPPSPSDNPIPSDAPSATAASPGPSSAPPVTSFVTPVTWTSVVAPGHVASATVKTESGAVCRVEPARTGDSAIPANLPLKTAGPGQSVTFTWTVPASVKPETSDILVTCHSTLAQASVLMRMKVG
jgi:hypothetical protein